MPHKEYLQLVHHVRNLIPPDALLRIFDIQMPKCGPREICNIHMITTVFDASATGLRWTIMASLEPSDLFTKHTVHSAYENDVFYFRVVWTLGSTGRGPDEHTIYYPHPIAFPYEKMRWADQQSSIGAGVNWDILIYYTIEPIDTSQLTAITIRRGTVRHARPGGPEP